MIEKRMTVLFMVVAVLLGTILGVSAAGAKCYTVPNNTHYVNPDTGAAADGGDTSTGESMCRNAVFPTSFYEEAEGRHYVTIRLKLISFIKDIRFSVQQQKGKDSYKEVVYTVTGENRDDNTMDLRFEVPSTDVLIRPSFFVGPMNRDVTFYVGLDMTSAEQGNGDFKAETSVEAEEPEPSADTEQAEPVNAKAEEKVQAEISEPKQTVMPNGGDVLQTSEPEMKKTAEPVADTVRENILNTPTDTAISSESPDEVAGLTEFPAEDTQTKNNFAVYISVAAVIVIAVAIVLIKTWIRRKRR